MKELLAFAFIAIQFTLHAQVFKPEDYGAKVNDGKDDSKAFQEMFNAIEKDSRRVTIVLNTGVYDLLSTVYYPKYNDRTTLIHGNNATLKARGQDYDVLVPGKSDANGLSSYRGRSVGDALEDNDHVTIRDVRFEGGRTQFRLVSTFLSVIEQCQFVGGYRGIDGIFALQTSIRDCWVNSFKGEGILLRSGEGDALTGEGKFFTNATGSNSQSNISTIQNCRIFANAPGKIGIRTYSSSNITIENTVIEGAPMKHAIHMDSRLSTTVVSSIIRNIHIEFNGNEADCESLIYIRGIASVELDNIYSQFGRVPQVHAKDCRRLFVTHWPYYPGGGFKTENSGMWWFDNNWNMAEDDYRGAEFWNNGEIPWYVCHRQNDAIFEVDHGFSNGLTTPTGNFGLKGDRISTNAASIMNTDMKDLSKAIDLKNYEIIQVIPYIMNDAEGKIVTHYIPILQPKKKATRPDRTRKQSQ